MSHPRIVRAQPVRYWEFTCTDCKQPSRRAKSPRGGKSPRYCEPCAAEREAISRNKKSQKPRTKKPITAKNLDTVLDLVAGYGDLAQGFSALSWPVLESRWRQCVLDALVERGCAPIGDIAAGLAVVAFKFRAEMASLRLAGSAPGGVAKLKTADTEPGERCA